MAKFEAESNDLTIRLDVLKPIHKYIKDLQVKTVQDVFSELLDHGNALFSTITGMKMEYHKGTIGYFHPDTNGWIEFSTWSGAEKLLGYASVALGISIVRGSRILVLDELATLDPRNFKLFLSVMEQAVEAGTLDQFIGCTPEILDLSPSGNGNALVIPLKG